MYALLTQTTWFTLASSSSMIVGVATITMVRSTRIMKKPRTRANSAGHGFSTSMVVVGTDVLSWAMPVPNTRWGANTPRISRPANFVARSTANQPHDRTDVSDRLNDISDVVVWRWTCS